MNHTSTAPKGAFFESSTPAVVIDHVTVTDPAVVTESQRWSTGRRGEAVPSDAMEGADLTAYVTQALAIGAEAITSAGGTQQKYDLERLLVDLGTRTTDATTRASDTTAAVVTHATDAMQKVSEDARRSITEAAEVTRKSFTDNVSSATTTLHDDIQRLLGGDHPELVNRLDPLLESFGQKLDTRSVEQSRTLLAKAARQFDPSDPTSPMAKHTKALQEQQSALTQALEQNYSTLVAKVDELTTAVKVSAAAKAAAATLARVTPLKGGLYADSIHLVMRDIAAGLGDEYADTSSIAGTVPRSKKGDGLLTVDGGAARVVLEMTDSSRTTWNAYLDEAERNREAAASLGLVREPAQNGGHTLRLLGARRIVLAFDPLDDDPELLRTVVQLLRVSAISASSRQNAEGMQTTDEKIAEALAMLGKIDDIKKAATSIRKGADKVEVQCGSLQSDLNRVLTQAHDALSGLAVTDELAANGATDTRRSAGAGPSAA